MTNAAKFWREDGAIVVRLREGHFTHAQLSSSFRTGFDAGKDIEFGEPVRPGDVLTFSAKLHDVYEKTGLSKSRSREVVENLLEIMKDTLASEENILISGFGKFNVKDKKARRGRNPQTGEELILDPRRVITFKPSGILRTKIND